VSQEDNDIISQIKRKRTEPNECDWKYEETDLNLPIEYKAIAENHEAVSSKTEQHIHPPKRKGNAFKAAKREAPQEGAHKMQREGARFAESWAEE
jgi:hypothetical protein